MRLVFLGSPQLAVPSLEALYKAEHQIIGLVSQPDRPKGRKLISAATPVKKFALENDITVFTPTDLNEPGFVEQYKGLEPEINIVVAYGRILPKWFIEHPKHGSINAHASLLPRWRGAAPIRRALMAGDKKTGMTIQQVVQKLDAGDIVLQEEINVQSGDDNEIMSNKMAGLAANMLVETLDLINKGDLPKKRQDEKKATYADKIEKAELRLDLNENAPDLQNKVKALAPRPGAFIMRDGKRLKIIKAAADEKSGEAGKVMVVEQNGILTGTGEGSLWLQEVQAEGGKKINAFDYAKGHNVKEGDFLNDDNS